MFAFYVQSKQIYTSRSNLMTASLQRSKKRVCILSCLMGHKSERLLGFQATARTWSSYSVWIIMASTRSISSGWIIQHFVSHKLQLCQGLQKISYDDFNRWHQRWFQSFCRDWGMIMMYAKYIVVRHFVLKSLTFEVEIFRTTYVKSGKIWVGDNHLFLGCGPLVLTMPVFSSTPWPRPLE